MAQAAYDCSAHFAKSSDLDDIVRFYEQHRTPSVHLRKREELQEAIDNGLFLIVRNTQKEIIAASAIYILNDGKPMPCSIDINTGRPQVGVVAELGSVLRRPDGLPEGKRYQGLWHAFLFSAPMVGLLDRLEKSRDLPRIDFLVADVQTQTVDKNGQTKEAGRSTMMRLMGHAQPSPLRWQMFSPAHDLEHAKSSTVREDDGQIKNPRQFFTAPIQNLPEVARYLRKVIQGGLISRYGDRVGIDMRDLYKDWTMDYKDEQRVTLLDFLAANSNRIEKLPPYSWSGFSTVSHNYGLGLNSMPQPLKTNNGYHVLDQSEPYVIGTAFASNAQSFGGNQQEQQTQQQQMQQQQQQQQRQESGAARPPVLGGGSVPAASGTRAAL